ncbi:baculoviral IAP repeat-containing protein 7-like isoform X9 [Clavelina lepadiformis]|uniref:baculoviral IAP repeat-containing protein 7-like isoform X9 n=1 Tax=Clavelina lepadiformis TaxID=159417 RepID=UPI0040430C55
MQTDQLIVDFPDLESDGRLLTQVRDPPGQRSHYIPPGDPARETYRLSTFKLFPREVQVDVRKLASAGFYFTGFKDRTKCFSCGQPVQEWEARDDPKLPQWHRSNCDITNGSDKSNIPIASFINQSTTSSNSTGLSSTQTTAREVQTSYVDHCQQRDNVTHNDVKSQNGSTSSCAATERPRITEERTTNQNLTRLFPCSNPVNPHMMSEESRLQTFLDHSSSWPAHRIRATPRQIANAGMYYLGVRDRVKCWYCNGGLQNWERDDDPWEEHAKWFPMCEFVLQRKGPDYVHGIVSRFPNLRRPIIRNPANPLQLRNVQSGPILQNENRNVCPEIIDSREETRSLERKVDEEMSSSELVEQVKFMGFDERMIKTAFKRKYEGTGNGFSRLEILVESILAMEEESASNRSKEGRSTFATAQATPSTSASNLFTTSGLQEIRCLQEERMCKVCGNEQASVVLIPCGHIACCVGCAENASTCPICRLRVREKIRSFIV